MVTPGPASIVVVEFPFSDLSGTKLRPAVVLTDAGQGDWILCQITSNPRSDPRAVKLTPAALRAGALADTSFARPTKLFTAHESNYQEGWRSSKPGASGCASRVPVEKTL